MVGWLPGYMLRPASAGCTVAARQCKGSLSNATPSACVGMLNKCMSQGRKHAMHLGPCTRRSEVTCTSSAGGNFSCQGQDEAESSCTQKGSATRCNIFNVHLIYCRGSGTSTTCQAFRFDQCEATRVPCAIGVALFQASRAQNHFIYNRIASRALVALAQALPSLNSCWHYSDSCSTAQHGMGSGRRAPAATQQQQNLLHPQRLTKPVLLQQQDERSAAAGGGSGHTVHQQHDALCQPAQPSASVH